MSELKQSISFCTTRDGVRIAYAVMGKGPPLVWGPHYICHLEFDLKSPVWRPWLVELTRHNTLIRYDQRGCGLSDRDVGDLSLDKYLIDLETVVDAAKIDRFALFGISQGPAISIAYAARHPERVTHLAIYGGWARGLMKRDPSPEQVREARAMRDLVEVGWGSENPVYRQMFTSIFIPDASAEQAAWFNEQERTCTTPDLAAKIIASYGPIDVTSTAAEVRCPTLVMHLRDDQRVPFEEGRLIAGLIPGARFVPLDGRNHVLLQTFPEFTQMFGELHAFLQSTGGATASSTAFPELTEREREIVELLAHGLDNSQIAARLGLSEKTVRNNITPIFDKLGAESRPQAIVRAREAGFAATPLPKAP
jgi:pimeloyl-ACP methyl ester carboxylesterase/DNA-binding CsgD family transcriptional regulator